jgi:hypothetical protein
MQVKRAASSGVQWYAESRRRRAEKVDLRDYLAYLRRFRRADERTRTAYPCSSYE